MDPSPRPHPIADFLGPVPGSVAGHVGHRELARSYLASGAAAALLGCVAAGLQAASDHASEIFSPTYVALGSWLIGLALDLVRRMRHEAPIAAPVAAPPAPPSIAIYRGTPHD